MSKVLRFRFETSLTLSSPVTDHSFRLCCVPREYPGQKLLDYCLFTEPYVPLRMQRDGFGNLLQIGYMDKEHSSFTYCCEGTVAKDSSLLIKEIPNPVLRYHTKLTMPSCELLSALPLCSEDASEEERAMLALSVAHSCISYASGSTKVHTTAAEAFSLGKGVCQDYAHIFLAFARELGLHARYCCGLVPGEGESHAWAEVNINGKWRGFDPTRGCETDDTYILLGTGRDFEDCPVERGLFKGQAAQKCTAAALVEVISADFSRRKA